MFDLEELEHLSAFARLGTLARVAEEYHISTPSVTRSMQHVEAEFGVALFVRSKNRIELNETGKKAAELTERVLYDLREARTAVREYDRRRHMIVLESCAPMPMWYLQRELEQRSPGCVIASSIQREEKLTADLAAGLCDLAIFPHPVSLPGISLRSYIDENLMVCIPEEHPLAELPEISFQELNGCTFLLRSELGFWEELCRRCMPDSRFLVQQGEQELIELEDHSNLFSFVTNRTERSYPKGRRIIPITDAEAHVIFSIAASAQGAK